MDFETLQAAEIVAKAIGRLVTAVTVLSLTVAFIGLAIVIQLDKMESLAP